MAPATLQLHYLAWRFQMRIRNSGSSVTHKAEPDVILDPLLLLDSGIQGVRRPYVYFPGYILQLGQLG